MSKSSYVNDHCRTVSKYSLQICSLEDVQDESILVWFTMETSANRTFDSYRFTLQPIGNSLLSSSRARILTNFSRLTEFNNSLHMLHLDNGQYEVCIEFGMLLSTSIYQLRDSCLPIFIGPLSIPVLKTNPKSLFITLASGIVLFFSLGLIVQWVKAKRRNQDQTNSKPRPRSSSIRSAALFRQQQHESLVQYLFHIHIDPTETSYLRQWARNLTFRHRVSTESQDFKAGRTLRRLKKYLLMPTSQSSRSPFKLERMSHHRTPSLESTLSSYNIYTMSEKVRPQICPKRISFDLSPLSTRETTSIDSTRLPENYLKTEIN